MSFLYRHDGTGPCNHCWHEIIVPVRARVVTVKQACCWCGVTRQTNVPIEDSKAAIHGPHLGAPGR